MVDDNGDVYVSTRQGGGSVGMMYGGLAGPTDTNEGTVGTVVNNTDTGGTTYIRRSGPARAPVDPYARWGGKAAYDNKRSGFANQKSSILNSANAAAQQRGLREYFRNLRAQRPQMR